VHAQTPSDFSSFVSEEKSRSRPTRADSSAVVSSTPQPTAPITRSSPVEVNKSHAKVQTPLGKIDINTATEKELMTVPGIGHVMAARIIAARPFHSANDLKRVSGIGDKKYESIRPYFQ
jgi:competence protein ComEA